MTVDTITLRLEGEIGLGSFVEAVSHFNAIVRGLSDEFARAAKIDWDLAGLNYGSAELTLVGRTAVPGLVSAVQRAYERVGEALVEGRDIPSASPRVVVAAEAMRSLLNGRIVAIRFETPDRDVFVTKERPRPTATVPRNAYGAVQGRVQALTNRSSHRFTLYDREFDRAVGCYLDQQWLGAEPDQYMLGLWDRRVIVEGWVERNPLDGRPVTVRRITHIEPLPETDAGSYVHVRGLVPLPEDAPRPETTIRRMRDA
ncbi:MAG: hypothetical protein HYX51_03430 [Chloroflexi bacterium]|nr:hypothetical protein [Chloroflexota bacterium]